MRLQSTALSNVHRYMYSVRSLQILFLQTKDTFYYYVITTLTKMKKITHGMCLLLQ